MTCPGVLVCVGREAFSPTLVNFIRKNSEEKLPGLGSRSSGLGPRTPGNGARSPAMQGARSPPHGAQSRASEHSEGHDSKKNGKSFRPTVFSFSEGHKTYVLLCSLLLMCSQLWPRNQKEHHPPSLRFLKPLHPLLPVFGQVVQQLHRH